MNRTGRVVLAVFLLWLMGAGPAGWTAEDELNIGIPDFPRRISRDLPELRPEQEINLGILEVHPMFKSVVEFDDNITLSNEDEKKDVIFTETPAIGTEMKLGDHRLEAVYGMEIVTFAKEEEENAINHLASGLLELNFDELTIIAQEAVEKATSRRFSETSERDELLINTVEILSRYDRPKWAAEFGWRNNIIDHRSDVSDVNDYKENVLVVLAGYKILPKTLMLVETDIGWVKYDEPVRNPDHLYWQIFGGFRGKPTDKMAMTAKLGFQGRDIDDVPGIGRSSDFDGLVANFDFLFNPTESDTFRLGYLRTVRTSTFADNSWYRQDKIYTSYSKSFYRKWILTPRFGWQLNAYPEHGVSRGVSKLRRDDFWQAGIELRYKIQEWLSTGLAYKFRARNSNADPLDFGNNRVTFDVTFAY